jgi:hypothetical protein
MKRTAHFGGSAVGGFDPPQLLAERSRDLASKAVNGLKIPYKKAKRGFAIKVSKCLNAIEGKVGYPTFVWTDDVFSFVASFPDGSPGLFCSRRYKAGCTKSVYGSGDFMFTGADRSARCLFRAMGRIWEVEFPLIQVDSSLFDAFLKILFTD